MSFSNFAFSRFVDKRSSSTVSRVVKIVSENNRENSERRVRCNKKLWISLEQLKVLFIHRWFHFSSSLAIRKMRSWKSIFLDFTNLNSMQLYVLLFIYTRRCSRYVRAIVEQPELPCSERIQSDVQTRTAHTAASQSGVEWDAREKERKSR